MRHKNSVNHLSRTSSHRRAMINNMLTSLFEHGAIKTSMAKARVVSRIAERMITRAKTDTVHNRREVAKRIHDPAVLNSLFTSIATQVQTRNGGYTRILKLGYRRGDSSPVVLFELVDKPPKAQPEKPAKKTKKETAAAKTTTPASGDKAGKTTKSSK